MVFVRTRPLADTASENAAAQSLGGIRSFDEKLGHGKDLFAAPILYDLRFARHGTRFGLCAKLLSGRNEGRCPMSATAWVSL
jgi:hypothetical protein